MADDEHDPLGGEEFEEPEPARDDVEWERPEHADVDPDIRVEPPARSREPEVENPAAAGSLHEPGDDLVEAHRKLEARLLVDALPQALAAESGTSAYGFENIVGVGIAEKVTAGRATRRLAVAVYVVSKVPADQVHDAARVPDEVDGAPTDVVMTGEFRAQPFTGRYRPASAGVSIGHHQITAGTFGCLVRWGPGLHILSNNHVLANVNAGRRGDPILQPGPADGGGPDDVIATLRGVVPISFGQATNTVDCALAQTSTQNVRALNICLGRISPSVAACDRGLVVRKCGRTTQHTRGIITDCNATTRVSYGPAGAALFRDQIIVAGISPTPAFSQGGDSGSLIVSERGLFAVGLLFAGSPTTTIANKIGNVLAAFGASIV
ncbi:MAG: hypothetical protein M3296_06480 [Actinomycetota bacterium]|nr:hypothetical protein [Actinomycetota bacterium]